MKNLNDTIGNQTRVLPTFSSVIFKYMCFICTAPAGKLLWVSREICKAYIQFFVVTIML